MEIGYTKLPWELNSPNEKFFWNLKENSGVSVQYNEKFIS